MYKLCIEDLVDMTHLRRLGFWSGIFRLKVPPMVKNLIWRMCRGCFLTRVCLALIIFFCPFMMQVWQMTGI